MLMQFAQADIYLNDKHIPCNNNSISNIEVEIKSKMIGGFIANGDSRQMSKVTLNVDFLGEPPDEGIVRQNDAIVKISGISDAEATGINVIKLKKYIQLRLNGFSTLLSHHLISNKTGLPWRDFYVQESVFSRDEKAPDWLLSMIKNKDNPIEILTIHDCDLIRFFLCKENQIVGVASMDSKNHPKNVIFDLVFQEALKSVKKMEGEVMSTYCLRLAQWLRDEKGVVWISPFEVPYPLD